MRLPFQRRLDSLPETVRELVIFFGGLLLLGVLAAAALLVVWPQWRARQYRKAVAQVGLYAARGDYPALSAVLRKAISLSPNDAATWKMAARYLSQVGSAETVNAWQQVIQLTPEDSEARWALAQSALFHSQLGVAEKALATLSPDERNEVIFHQIAAELARALGRDAELVQHLGAVAAALPGDMNAQFNYALVRLNLTGKPDERAAALATLAAMTAEPPFHVRAVLTLLADAASRHDGQRLVQVMALALSRLAPEVTPDFSPPRIPAWDQLVQAIKRAARDPNDVVLVARWLADMNRTAEAFDWLTGLPAAVSALPAIADLEAELAARTDKLEKLQELLAAGAWSRWPIDAQTSAIGARREQLEGKPSRVLVAWESAQNACVDSEPGMAALARLARIWGQSQIEERVLKAWLQINPTAAPAYARLSEFYAARESWSELLAVRAQWASQAPQFEAVVLDWISLACVLNRVSPAAREKIEEMHERLPESAQVTAVLAAVRWRQGRALEAERLLGKIAPENRLQPRIAFWSVVVADAGGQPSAEMIAGAYRGAALKPASELLEKALRDSPKTPIN